MRIAHLAIGDRSFYLNPNEADEILSAVKVARESGEWISIHDAGGNALKLLIPQTSLLVFRFQDLPAADAYSDDDSGPGWVDLDY